MNFAFPWALALLPFPLLLLQKRPLHAITVSSLADWKNAPVPRRVRWAERLRIIQTLAGVLLVVALAGPYIEKPVVEEIRQGIAIKMLVDISSSMDRSIITRDGEKKTRIEAVKTVVETFIENRPDDLIGLITFARYADTLSPLTFGHNALIELVRDINIQDRPNEDGTAYGDALALAGAHLARMDKWNEESSNTRPVKTKTVILLTDGENNCGLHLPREAAALIAAWNIRLYSISLADSENDELTDSEKLLETISEATGGQFWKIAGHDNLSAAYDTIDRLEKSELKKNVITRTEQQHTFVFFALPAFLLLLLEQILSATLLRITGAD